MSQPLHIHVEMLVERPAREVWSYYGDPANDPEWRSGVLEMTADRPVPVTAGTRIHEVLRFAGTEHVTDTLVTETGPGLRYRFKGEGTGGKVRGGRAVREGLRPGTAVLTYDLALEPNLGRLVRPILSRLFAFGVRRDLEGLKRMLEAPVPAPVALPVSAPVPEPASGPMATAA